LTASHFFAGLAVADNRQMWRKQMKTFRDQMKSQNVDVAGLQANERAITPLTSAELDEIAGGSIFGKVRVVIKF
jgi:hypothetical protein